MGNQSKNSLLNRREYVKGLFYRHGIAIIFAFFAALLVGGPSVLAIHSLGSKYQGVPFLYQDSESVYLARIHDVLDGHPALGSPVFYEYKNVPTPLPPMGEYFYVMLKYITLLPLNDLIIFTKFFFPFILFITAYAASFAFLRQGIYPRLSALAIASLVLFGMDFPNFSYALSVWRDGSSVFYDSVWGRLVNPITGAILLFGSMYALKCLLEGRRYAWLYGGLMLGLMTGYIFSFALALTMVGVLIVVLSLEKRYKVVRALFITVFIGGLVNTFQFPSIVRALISPDSKMFSLRNGLLITHAPLIDKELILTSVLFIVLCSMYWIKAKRDRKEGYDPILICGSFLVASFLVMNQQIITGETIWPEHFVQYVIPLSYFSLITISSILIAQYNILILRWIWRGILIVSIFVSFAFALRTIDSYRAVLGDFTDIQRLGPAMQWLNTNAPKDCVVFAIEDTEQLASAVPALTDCNSYWSSYVFVGIPTSRIEHNYLMRLRFAGVTAENAPTYIHDHNTEYRSVLFTDWKQMFWYSNDPWLISISNRAAIQQNFDSLEVTLAADYKKELQGDFLSELKEYKLDYVIWDSNKYPDWDLSLFPFLHQVYGSQGVYIYTIS